MFSRFKEVYRYREMLFLTVKKDLRSRYRGSVLGFLWTFINPLLQLVVYSKSTTQCTSFQDYCRGYILHHHFKLPRPVLQVTQIW